ncbi:hypothetical protein D3C72_2064580 [compost metagenome]
MAWAMARCTATVWLRASGSLTGEEMVKAAVSAISTSALIEAMKGLPEASATAL